MPRYDVIVMHMHIKVGIVSDRFLVFVDFHPPSNVLTVMVLFLSHPTDLIIKNHLYLGVANLWPGQVSFIRYLP